MFGSVGTQSQTAQAGSILSNGLVGHWTYDEGSGMTTADSSGNGNMGTRINNPTWTAGYVGSGARYFDGVDDYVDVPNTVLNPSEGTVVLWMKTPSHFTGDLGTRLAFGNAQTSGGNRVYLGYTSTGKLVAALDELGNILGSQLAKDTWYHVALVWRTNGTGELFLNSVSDAVASSLTFVSSIQYKVSIGSYSEGYDSRYQGTLDDVRVYDRALSVSEVWDL